jgi:preprotein translocase subunit SecE
MTLKNNRLVRYIKDSYVEMKKVTWPTRKETIRITIVVIIISLSVAAFLGLLDYIFSLGIKEIITMKSTPKTIEAPFQANTVEDTIVPEDINFDLSTENVPEEDNQEESNN